jgi:glycerophosphoryl diester phosphodiesterase
VCRTENTLPAFHSALRLGADVLEMDVRLTADDRLVVFHDEDVNRTTDGHGLVRHKTLDEMRALDAGYRYTHDGGLSYPYRGGGVAGPQPLRVLTLDEFLDAFPREWINVEIKDREQLAAELTWQHLRRQPQYSSRFVVASRYCDVIDHFRNITRGAIATAACETEATNMRIKVTPSLGVLLSSWERGERDRTDAELGSASRVDVADPAGVRCQRPRLLS